MTTLFLIKVNGDNGAQVVCGPYLSLSEASGILAEHIPSILKASKIEIKNYVAQLQEVIPTLKGWELIDTKITATEVFNLED